jgi:uncharacterized protein
MQLIISPAKTQQFNGRNFAHFSQPACLNQAEQLNYRLQHLDNPALASLLKTSTPLTVATRQRIEAFTTPFSLVNARQALFTFQGEAFKAITADRYSREELAHAQSHLFILSGLYGILRPLDLIQPYRLEMATPLNIGNSGNLYQFWRERVTSLLCQAVGEDGVCVNLASQEYFRVINRHRLIKVVTISFKQEEKGILRTIAIHAKRARGLMVHHMISRRLTRAEQLQGFNLEGYAINEAESTAGEWVFSRKAEC